MICHVSLPFYPNYVMFNPSCINILEIELFYPQYIPMKSYVAGYIPFNPHFNSIKSLFNSMKSPKKNTQKATKIPKKIPQTPPAQTTSQNPWALPARGRCQLCPCGWCRPLWQQLNLAVSGRKKSSYLKAMDVYVFYQSILWMYIYIYIWMWLYYIWSIICVKWLYI